MQTDSGGRLELARATLERNRTVSVIVGHPGSVVRGVDLVVRETLANEDGLFGDGLAVEAGSRAELERVALLRNRTVGLLAAEAGTTVHATDLFVIGTLAAASDARSGYGLQAIMGAQLSIARARIASNRGFGIRASDPDTTVLAQDVVVEDTAEQGCAADACKTTPAGIGIGADASAAVEVRRFRSSGNALCGVLVASGGTLDLHEGEVSQNPIGGRPPSRSVGIHAGHEARCPVVQGAAHECVAVPIGIERSSSSIWIEDGRPALGAIFAIGDNR